MMTASLFSSLSADSPAASASTGAGASSGALNGVAGSEAGAAFNAILTTMLPGAGDTLAAGALLPAAETDAGEALALILPGLGLGDTATGEPALAGESDAGRDDDSAELAGDDVQSLLADWLPALPLAAPLRTTGFMSASLSGNVAGGAAASLTAAHAGLLSRAQLLAQKAGESLPSGNPSGLAGIAALTPDARAMAALQAVADAATAGSTPSAPAITGTTAQVSGWPLANQGLEGLLRSREGRLVQALDLPSEVSSLTLPGQPLTQAGGRDIALISIPQHALQSPDWGDAFNQHLVTLAQQGTQSASLSLNPEDLGPIHVKISMHEQGASIEFAARHAATSELIESAMPRLASALEAHGLRLDDARVSQLSARGDGFNLAAGQQGGDPRSGQSSSQNGQPAAGDAAARQLVAGDDGQVVTRSAGLRHDDGSIDAYA